MICIRCDENASIHGKNRLIYGDIIIGSSRNIPIYSHQGGTCSVYQNIIPGNNVDDSGSHGYNLRNA